MSISVNLLLQLVCCSPHGGAHATVASTIQIRSGEPEVFDTIIMSGMKRGRVEWCMVGVGFSRGPTMQIAKDLLKIFLIILGTMESHKETA